MSLSNTPSNQTEVIGFLSNPMSYLGKPAFSEANRYPRRNRFFWQGTRLRRSGATLTFPYMDFSTLEKRRVVVWREVELNRQTAPQLYIGAAAICRDRTGFLNLDGREEPIEWAVRMRRFDQKMLQIQLKFQAWRLG